MLLLRLPFLLEPQALPSAMLLLLLSFVFFPTTVTAAVAALCGGWSCSGLLKSQVMGRATWR